MTSLALTFSFAFPGIKETKSISQRRVRGRAGLCKQSCVETTPSYPGLYTPNSHTLQSLQCTVKSCTLKHCMSVKMVVTNAKEPPNSRAEFAFSYTMQLPRDLLSADKRSAPNDWLTLSIGPTEQHSYSKGKFTSLSPSLQFS